ncbi:unnamed protein product [Ostreobium quekettii]|uniref:Uncharacterized protein n=1 Tax=Ostreobium quekettii TaxID=121088 RepID=A0A8S1IWJ9_9CHLO|nr:unnamed protein product [Ostreobium quekettii]|eukprot:evm.model.scf_1035.2 EVM.evm.TU.scf_1035.2   scf_1035:27218-34902(+)
MATHPPEAGLAPRRQPRLAPPGDPPACRRAPRRHGPSGRPPGDGRMAFDVRCLAPGGRSMRGGGGRDGDVECRTFLEELEKFVTSEGTVEEVSEEQSRFDYLGESNEGDLQLMAPIVTDNEIKVLGLKSAEEVVDMDYGKLHKSTQGLLDQLGVPLVFPEGLPQRGIYCSRTLNFRSIKCIGYDMDYTLVHYDVNAWEGRAYQYGIRNLRSIGYPTEGLRFDPDLVVRGLVVDKELGNIVKTDRFGIPRRGMHGTKQMSINELRHTYGRQTVDLRNEERWNFINTFFSVSEANLYLQMVDRLDQGQIPISVGSRSYLGLYKAVGKALYQTHVEGVLKEEIIQDPGKFVQVDPDIAQTLLYQREAGKKLLLITNSEYEYTNKMMSFAIEPFLPGDMKWRDLFDMVIVQARKPDFFTYNMSLYEVVTDDGLMRPCHTARPGGLYCGGSARMVEKTLNVEGDDVLYVGDHIYTDAALAKINFKWRTALIVREMEKEIAAVITGQEHREQLNELVSKKELIGDVFNQLRLRKSVHHNGQLLEHFHDEENLNRVLAQLLMVMNTLDEHIGDMLEREGEHFNKIWGYLCRTGLHDKSALTRQIEKWADIYTSRVSNFKRYTPFMYFRSPSQSLAHDRRIVEPNEDPEFKEMIWQQNGCLEQT